MSNIVYGSDHTLKGGEIMRINHVILMGIFVGAAVFLPQHTFAENNRGADHASQNSAVHTDVAETIDIPKKSDKAISPTPKTEHHRQGEGIQKQKKDPGPPLTIPVKPSKPSNKDKVRVEQTVPSPEIHRDKARGSGTSANTAGKEKDTDSEGRENEKSHTHVESDSPERLHTHPSKDEVKGTNQKPLGENGTSTLTEPTVSRETGGAIKVVHKPVVPRERKTPSEEKNHPGDVEVIHNPPQRMQTSGGTSPDLTNTGASGTSFVAHVFDWGVGLIFGNIYYSQDDQYWYQWMNAPPSPPPKAAPLT